MRGLCGGCESAMSPAERQTHRVRKRYESGVRSTGVNLTQRESEVIESTQPGAMAHLDTDELMDLHAKVRRVRNKYVQLYRRRGAAKVRAKGARGVAAEANERGWAKAEVFEEALARVSRQLAAAAQLNARELKRERLERAGKQVSGPSTSGDSATAKKTGTKKGAPKTGAAEKSAAKKPAAKKSAAKASSAKDVRAERSKATTGKPAKTTGRIKSEASSKAAGARRQAKRDSR